MSSNNRLGGAAKNIPVIDLVPLLRLGGGAMNITKYPAPGMVCFVWKIDENLRLRVKFSIDRETYLGNLIPHWEDHVHRSGLDSTVSFEFELCHEGRKMKKYDRVCEGYAVLVTGQVRIVNATATFASRLVQKYFKANRATATSTQANSLVSQVTVQQQEATTTTSTGEDTINTNSSSSSSILRKNLKYTNTSTMSSQATQDALYTSTSTRYREARIMKVLDCLSDPTYGICKEDQFNMILEAFDKDIARKAFEDVLVDLYEMIFSNPKLSWQTKKRCRDRLKYGWQNTIVPLLMQADRDEAQVPLTRYQAVKNYHRREQQQATKSKKTQRLAWDDSRNTTWEYDVQRNLRKTYKIHQPIPVDQMKAGNYTSSFNKECQQQQPRVLPVPVPATATAPVPIATVAVPIAVNKDQQPDGKALSGFEQTKGSSSSISSTSLQDKESDRQLRDPLSRPDDAEKRNVTDDPPRKAQSNKQELPGHSRESSEEGSQPPEVTKALYVAKDSGESKTSSTGEKELSAHQEGQGDDKSSTTSKEPSSMDNKEQNDDASSTLEKGKVATKVPESAKQAPSPDDSVAKKTDAGSKDSLDSTDTHHQSNNTVSTARIPPSKPTQTNLTRPASSNKPCEEAIAVAKATAAGASSSAEKPTSDEEDGDTNSRNVSVKSPTAAKTKEIKSSTTSKKAAIDNQEEQKTDDADDIIDFPLNDDASSTDDYDTLVYAPDAATATTAAQVPVPIAPVPVSVVEESNKPNIRSLAAVYEPGESPPKKRSCPSSRDTELHKKTPSTSCPKSFASRRVESGSKVVDSVWESGQVSERMEHPSSGTSKQSSTSLVNGGGSSSERSGGTKLPSASSSCSLSKNAKEVREGGEKHYKHLNKKDHETTATKVRASSSVSATNASASTLPAEQDLMQMDIETTDERSNGKDLLNGSSSSTRSLQDGNSKNNTLGSAQDPAATTTDDGGTTNGVTASAKTNENVATAGNEETGHFLDNDDDSLTGTTIEPETVVCDECEQEKELGKFSITQIRQARGGYYCRCALCCQDDIKTPGRETEKNWKRHNDKYSLETFRQSMAKEAVPEKTLDPNGELQERLSQRRTKFFKDKAAGKVPSHKTHGHYSRADSQHRDMIVPGFIRRVRQELDGNCKWTGQWIVQYYRVTVKDDGTKEFTLIEHVVTDAFLKNHLTDVAYVDLILKAIQMDEVKNRNEAWVNLDEVSYFSTYIDMSFFIDIAAAPDEGYILAKTAENMNLLYGRTKAFFETMEGPQGQPLPDGLEDKINKQFNEKEPAFKKLIPAGAAGSGKDGDYDFLEDHEGNPKPTAFQQDKYTCLIDSMLNVLVLAGYNEDELKKLRDELVKIKITDFRDKEYEKAVCDAVGNALGLCFDKIHDCDWKTICKDYPLVVRLKGANKHYAGISGGAVDKCDILVEPSLDYLLKLTWGNLEKIHNDDFEEELKGKFAYAIRIWSESERSEYISSLSDRQSTVCIPQDSEARKKWSMEEKYECPVCKQKELFSKRRHGLLMKENPGPEAKCIPCVEKEVEGKKAKEKKAKQNRKKKAAKKRNKGKKA